MSETLLGQHWEGAHGAGGQEGTAGRGGGLDRDSHLREPPGSGAEVTVLGVGAGSPYRRRWGHSCSVKSRG